MSKNKIETIPYEVALETDHLLLEHAVETATDFLTIDELIADYEEHAKEGKTILYEVALIGNRELTEDEIEYGESLESLALECLAGELE